MNIRKIIRGLVKEAINRSYGNISDLARYRDINLDSPSSLSKARSSQGLKASNVSDSKKNIPFDSKISRVYAIMLRYISNKFKLKNNSNDLRERGKELSNFIKSFLTRDEVENFYYRLSRFSSNTTQFKRICEQLLNYMETGQMSDIDIYDSIDMGDENDRDAYNVSPSEILQDRINNINNKKIGIKQKIENAKYLLNYYSRYRPLGGKDINFAISNGLIDSDEYSKKVSAILNNRGREEMKKDIFINMLKNTLKELNNEINYLDKKIVDIYNDYKQYGY
jgi:hypothetical protein